MTHALAPESTVSRIRHYELRSCLGEGGCGQVYEAWDQLLQRHVALKCLSLHIGHVSDERLIREARLAASLQHGAFVKIFGFEDDGRSQFIVMELVRGHTLQDRAADFIGNRVAVLDIGNQVAAAMAQAHAVGLVHGDLKPANLMMEADGTVRILDFGLASQIDPLATITGAPDDPLGTIGYMAPERLSGLPASAATDIYALGVVLYRLITGERPHPGLHGLALASAHMHSSSNQWAFPALTDHGILQLILAMTAHDPAARMPAMNAVCGHIARLLKAPDQPPAPAATAVSVPSGAAPRRLPRRSRRRLAAWIGGALLAALAAAALLTATSHMPIAVAPYSEAAALHTGLQALRDVDRDGKIEEALTSFGAILDHAPTHAAATAGQSLAYSMRYSGDGRDEVWLRKAAVSATLAVQANDQLALAHAARSWASALQGQVNEALAAADRALALDPSDTWALTSKINVLLRIQRQDEARTLIAQASARWPRDRAFTDLEGTLLFQQGDYQGAERAFRHSLRLAPEAVLPYANLSAALLRQARSDEALAILQQGLRIQPSGVLYTNLGTVLFNRGDPVRASTAFQHAVSASKGGPNDFLKWANLADALRWIPGREADATNAYRRAMHLLRPMLARAPDDPTHLTRMGLYAAHVGDAGAALAWTERGAALAPSNPDVRFRAALANELSGQRSAALGHLARAIVLGYPFSYIEAAPELVALRRDARYQTLAMEHER